MRSLLISMLCLLFSSQGQAQPSDTIDVVHYRIHISDIQFSQKTIKASAKLTLVTKLPTTLIPLELRQLVVDSAKVNGQMAVFSQTTDRLVVFIGFETGIHDTLQVEIVYGGTPFSEQWGGFHFSGSYAFNLGVGFVSIPHNLGKAWFPCVDNFTDRATYEILATVPTGMKAISGGQLLSVTPHAEGTSTWHWKLHRPIPTYLASLAVGNYTTHEWTIQGQQKPIPVRVFVRPQDSAKVPATFQTLGQIVQIFENRFGSYPFDHIGYTGTAIGAMEHVENIFLPHSSISGNLNSEYLIAHELSHMWFGNATTCASASEMWLNEGWATFCHHFYKYDLQSPQAYRNEINHTHYEVLRNAHITDGGYWALNNVPEQYTYGATSYDKGATVIHTLMHQMGMEKFFPAVRSYLENHRFAPASSTDLRDALAAHSGLALNDFFDTWVLSPGTPHFWYDSLKVTPEGNLYRTELFLKQKHKGGNHVAYNHIHEITFMGPQWQLHTDTVRYNGPTSKSVKWLPFEPLLVMPDFYDKTLDATTDFFGVIRNSGTINLNKINLTLYIDALPDSAFYRVTHHWVAPDSLKTNIPGLRLSPYRHWEISGLFHPGTQMRGRFFYSNSPNLDGTLIRSASDSVVILYRPSAAHDWQAIAHTRTGLWSIGYLNVENLQPGQYTLAAWDLQMVGTQETKPKKQMRLIAKPNPTKDTLLLQWDNVINGELVVIDALGQSVHQSAVKHTSELNLSVHDWPSGLYVIFLNDTSGNSQGVVKFLKQ